MLNKNFGFQLHQSHIPPQLTKINPKPVRTDSQTPTNKTIKPYMMKFKTKLFITALVSIIIYVLCSIVATPQQTSHARLLKLHKLYLDAVVEGLEVLEKQASNRAAVLDCLLEDPASQLCAAVFLEEGTSRSPTYLAEMEKRLAKLEAEIDGHSEGVKIVEEVDGKGR